MINSVYNYYAAQYGHREYSKYDTHSKAQLKSTFGRLQKINSQTPSYKIDFSDAALKYAIDLNLYYRGGELLFPLYLYNDNSELFEKNDKQPNYTDKFIKEYLNKLSFKPTPEEVLSYIYAVLHSSVYRTKYIEFLKTDFPAIPMTKNQEIFEKYAKEGQKLIDVHLMNKIIDDKSIKVSLDGAASNFVVADIIEPSTTESALSLVTADNKTIKFDGITTEMYNFEIGSYRPIDKWLKYRKQDHVILNIIDDVMHIKNMALAIKETIKIMAIISSYGEDYLK